MPNRGYGDVSGGRVSPGRLRLAVGLGAAAATVPYLALKGAWVAGSTVGMADPGFFRTSTYFVANLVSFRLDAVAVGVALALTFSWGRRLPGWLVLFPMWVATGLLGTIAVLLPVAAPLATATPAGGAGEDPLESWVYLLVYAGFAAQGLLLLAAFVLYARQCWPQVFQLRLDQVRTRESRSLPALLAAAGCALAALVGVLNLAGLRCHCGAGRSVQASDSGRPGHPRGLRGVRPRGRSRRADAQAPRVSSRAAVAAPRVDLGRHQLDVRLGALLPRHRGRGSKPQHACVGPGNRDEGARRHSGRGRDAATG